MYLFIDVLEHSTMFYVFPHVISLTTIDHSWYTYSVWLYCERQGVSGWFTWVNRSLIQHSESIYLDNCSDLWYIIFHANQAFSFQIKISWGSQLQPATSRCLIFSAHQCIPPSSLAFMIFICISLFLIIFHCFWSFIFIHSCNFH